MDYRFYTYSFYFYLESHSTGTVVKTEAQDESAIDMFSDEFHAIMEKEFSDKTNDNETREAERINEEDLETDSDATEIDEDHSAVSGQFCCWYSFYLFI